MSKEKRLGRGLEALLGKAAAASADYSFASPAAAEWEKGGPDSERRLSLYNGESDHDEGDETETDKILGELMKGQPTFEVPIDRIDRNPHQPRLDFSETELAALAESLQQHGMIQPIVLRRTEQRFELIAGERRMRAAVLAGWTTIPARLLVVDDREMAELALTENLQRRDLNAIEKAAAFRHYLDLYGGTHDELAKRLDLDRSTVTNLMRLLELPEALQASVRRGELTQGHVRALLPLEESEQFETAERIRKEGWSVRQTESYIQELLADENGNAGRSGVRRPIPHRSEHFMELENQFRNLFGTKVQLTANEKGKGKLVIAFGNNAEFERIYQLILARMK